MILHKKGTLYHQTRQKHQIHLDIVDTDDDDVIEVIIVIFSIIK